MLLAIDTGNTNAKFALVDDTGKILQRWRIATDARRTADEYAVWLDQLIQMAGYRRSDIDAVIIATVVPRALHNLQLLATRYFRCEALVAGRGAVGWGIQLRVAEPHSVGADRAVNGIAAQSLTEAHKIVISFGTATTFDVVDFDGAYIGGVIAPGANLSLEALHMAAAALPHVDVAKPARVIGTNTVACMQSGVYWGYIGLVEGIVREVRKERPGPMKVIATGGLAALFAQGTDTFDVIEDDLTMHGLVLIHALNKDHSAA